MSTYEPEAGDIVSALMVVVGEARQGQLMAQPLVGAGPLTRLDTAQVVFVERPEPEPEWQPGDVAVDARGEVYVLTGEASGIGPWLWVNAPDAVHPWLRRSSISGRLVRFQLGMERSHG